MAELIIIQVLFLPYFGGPRLVVEGWEWRVEFALGPQLRFLEVPMQG